jgi:hypothetical protein
VKVIKQPYDAAPLEQVVADMRSEAMLLERNGARDLAASKRFDADRIAHACPEAMEWLSEKHASLRSGWSIARVRRHAQLYERAKFARRIGKRGPWQLLAIIVPQALPTSVLEHAAREAAAS